MHRPRTVFLLVLLLAFLAGGASARQERRLPRDPRAVPQGAILTKTTVRADLDGDGRSEGLVLVNALTGSKSSAQATEVIFGVVSLGGSQAGRGDGELIWVRHLMSETGKPARNGEMMSLDLDGDGAWEVILTWDRSEVADEVNRWAEIYAVDEVRAPRKVWEGPWERDNRRSAKTGSAETFWFQREVDFGATRRAAGRRIVFRKVQRVLAGQSLNPPEVVVETADVRLRPRGWASR